MNNEEIDQSRYTSEELLYLLLDLLTETTPFTYEVAIHKYLPDGGYFDDIGNYIFELGDSQTLFCCHMDTVGRKQEYVNPLYIDGIIKSNITTSCLGGDDRCGMLCCLAMINAGVPGTYIFHVGEERGAIGAEHIVDTFDLSKFKRAVEFDRRGTTSIITEMMISRVCSDVFALDLASKLGLGFVPDDTGIFTDVYKYKHIIPEVTNLSVGYYNEHSPKESIDADWLIFDFIPRLLSLDWESLIVDRDPLKEEDEFEAMMTYYREDFNKKYFSEENTYSMYNDFEYENSKYKEGAEEEEETEENFFTIRPYKPMHKKCEFCEKTDEGDLIGIEIEGDSHYLCMDCYDYLCSESNWVQKPRKQVFKSLLPEFEQYSAI
jgi:hypothetical protein